MVGRERGGGMGWEGVGMRRERGEWGGSGGNGEGAGKGEGAGEVRGREEGGGTARYAVAKINLKT